MCPYALREVFTVIRNDGGWLTSSNNSFQNHLKAEVSENEQIYETGCLVTMEQWFNTNLYYIGGAALGVAVVQVSVSI